MLEQLKALLELNFGYLFFGFCVILIVGKVLWTALEWLFVEKLKIETGSQRERRKEKERLDAVITLANTTAENLDKLENRHNKDEEEFREKLDKHIVNSEKDRKAIHKDIQQYSDNRIKDRQQSLEIQKKLVDAQNKISDSVQGLVDKFDEFKTDTNDRFNLNEEKENKRVRAELKSSISEIYRHHHATGQINDIELETLEDLIEEYEAAGGENSFVHSLVQKEMYTWEKVERK